MAKQEQDASAGKTETTELDLDCVLTKDDIEERAAQLLSVSEQRRGELGRAGRLRMEAAELKDRAKAKDAEACESEQEAEMLLSDIEDLIRAVNDKVETRPVECNREYDYKANVVRTTRLDTGEVVEEREMRTSERQMSLAFELGRRGQGTEGFRDKRGRLLFVSDGFTDGKEWATYYRSETGALKRFTGKGLDVRDSRDKADADLEKYAVEHGFDYWNDDDDFHVVDEQDGAADEEEPVEAA